MFVLAPGSVFHDAFEVVRCISAGGMGAVYEVLHVATQRRRALKLMLPSIVANAELRARFALEARVAAGIDSESIVETLDAGIDAATGLPFIVMELLKGEEMGQYLEAGGAFSPALLVDLLSQAARALDKTHAAGVVHRDLKPANLFLTKREDGSLRVKILDFGVAKIVETTSAGHDRTRSVGSPLYMSPEQIHNRGKITPRADLYSLGHIAFTMLVGRPYWHEEQVTSGGIYPFLLAVMQPEREPASARAKRYGADVAEGFDAWFARATAMDPTARFPSAGAQIAALKQLLDRPQATASPAQGALPPAEPPFASQSDAAATALLPQPLFPLPRVSSGERADSAGRDEELTAPFPDAPPPHRAPDLAPRGAKVDLGASRPAVSSDIAASRAPIRRGAAIVLVALAGVAVAALVYRTSGSAPDLAATTPSSGPSLSPPAPSSPQPAVAEAAQPAAPSSPATGTPSAPAVSTTRSSATAAPSHPPPTPRAAPPGSPAAPAPLPAKKTPKGSLLDRY